MKLTKPRRHGDTTGTIFEAIGLAMKSHERNLVEIKVDRNSPTSGWDQVKMLKKKANDIIEQNRLQMKVTDNRDKSIYIQSTYPVTYEDENGNIFTVTKEEK